ncbi:MAG: alpha/beta hydrolase [Gammaproteobacteria bacterium]|nr:MAG: alpha/beta hydrolase [Gammaproteobacteria bacterium]
MIHIKCYRYLIRFVFLYFLVFSAMADIHEHCQGQGPLIYLIGGGPAFTTWNLQPIQDRLSKRYRVCRWDMRGVGDNAGLRIDQHKPLLSQWIEDMRNVLPPQPVVLWGHSWGALQVLLYAKSYPDHVSKAVLSNPVDPELTSLEHIERKRFVHRSQKGNQLQLKDIDTAVEKRHSLRSKIASYFVDAELGWNYANQFAQSDMNSELNVRIWKDYTLSPLTKADVRQLADKVRGVIYCQYDLLQPENLDAYKPLLKNSKHHMLAECGHFPWVENPDAYYKALLKLIDE